MARHMTSSPNLFAQGSLAYQRIIHPLKNLNEVDGLLTTNSTTVTDFDNFDDCVLDQKTNHKINQIICFSHTQSNQHSAYEDLDSFAELKKRANLIASDSLKFCLTKRIYDMKAVPKTTGKDPNAQADQFNHQDIIARSTNKKVEYLKCLKNKLSIAY